MTDIDKARSTFQEAGLSFPKVPAPLDGELKEQSKWIFSTCKLKMSPYILDYFVEHDPNARVPYVVLAHSGHGVNSYAIQYYLVTSPLRLFLHLGWGGAYNEAAADVAKIRECFALADEIVEIATGSERLANGEVFTVVASDLYRSYWYVGEKKEADNRSTDKRPSKVLNDVLSWLKNINSGGAFMISPSKTAINETIGVLKSSPLFNLSLASKELFHSNFLAWLCQEYPKLAFQLFAQYLKDPPTTCDQVTAERERKNIDLWLTFSGVEELAIENKVKSIPDQSQLNKYAEEIKGTHIGFMLLSLTRPEFLSDGKTSIVLENGETWHYLSYVDLAKKLRDLADLVPAETYHRQLLDDYIKYITHLDALQYELIIKWEEPAANFFGVQKEIDDLKKIRVHDLIEKLRYNQIAQRVRDVLRREKFNVQEDGELWDASPGTVFVKAAMAHGVGLVDLKYLLINDAHAGKLILGVQVQGNHFRLVVEVPKGGSALAAANRLFEPSAGNKIWFDFKLLSNGSEEFPKKGQFNRFGNVFYYRSKRLSDISPQSLVDAIVSYTLLIQKNDVALQEQIRSVL
jgi:hypothetical protein